MYTTKVIQGSGEWIQESLDGFVDEPHRTSQTFLLPVTIANSLLRCRWLQKYKADLNFKLQCYVFLVISDNIFIIVYSYNVLAT